MLRRRHFLQQLTAASAAFTLSQVLPKPVLAELGKSALARGIPEVEGLSSGSILSFIESVEQKKSWPSQPDDRSTWKGCGRRMVGSV